ncbi:MAG: acetylserotonin O-methyltransferase [Thermoproteota archaeon]|nr:acetylserotonin O-methyltransferase [Thermoproteota archaeon]
MEESDKTNTHGSTASFQTTMQVSPDPIFQMVTGFCVSKTLMTAVELEVFTKLSGNTTVDINEFQNMLGIQKRPADVFATALVSLGLLNVTKSKEERKRETGIVNIDEHNRRYSNSQLSEVFLDKSKPSYIGDFIIMMDKHLYDRWGKLPISLKTNQPVEVAAEGDNISSATMFDKAKSNQLIEKMEMFTHAMYGVSVGPAMALAKVFDFSSYNKLMDIGGGSGVYAIEVLKQNPNMSAVVFELEPACRVADQYIKRFNLQDKIHTQVLDFFKDNLPTDYDVALLSHIIHFLDEEKDRMLLKKIYDSLPNDRNSVIIISEWLLNDEKTGPVPSALLSLTMIVDQKQGRNYSFSEVSKMLTDVGFTNIEKRPLAGPAEIVIGYKNTKQRQL